MSGSADTKGGNGTVTFLSDEIRALFVERLVEWINAGDFCECGPLDNSLINLCESEIERRMMIHLLFAEWGYANWQEVALHDPTMPYPLGNEVITLAPQQPAGKYRVDIAVFVQAPDGKRLQIAIECDGHDYHERSKEQAERDKRRDRELQKAGWMVFRFTGSEIYRHGKDRAEEVAAYVRQWLEKAIG